MGEGQKMTLLLAFIVFLSQICWTRTKGPYLFHYTSTYGAICSDGCRMGRSGYSWCHTEKGWDYCSIRKNTDYKGNECRGDHPCGKYDESYYWCWKKAGSWDYCGKVELKAQKYIIPFYPSVCTDECLKSDKYYWCNTGKGWDYCSPTIDVTYKNEPCRSDHSCDTHGERYTWCYTDSSWDYCGIIMSNECIYISTGHKERLVESFSENDELICTRTDKSNKKVTTFYAESNPTAIADGSTWRNELTDLTSRWYNTYLGNQAKSGLVTTINLRIDQQGQTSSYYNLQIQVNRPRQPGKSTTVAQVLIPRNECVPDRYVRMAFVESFRRRAKVTVKVDSAPSRFWHGQNCDSTDLIDSQLLSASHNV